MKNTKLYIIGNGFDLYHKLNTSYQAFAFYLQDEYPKTHENLVNYFGLPWLERDDPDDHRNPLWSYFERALADLNFQTVLEDYSDYMANPGAEDFESRDWHSYQIEMERVVDELTTELRRAFKNFICSVAIPSELEVVLLQLMRSAIFLNFNYTPTLERLYGVKQPNINYIHGSALNPRGEIVLGHGADPKSLIPAAPSPPKGLSKSAIQEWYEREADNHEYSYNQARTEILGYFAASQKLTKEIIEDNSSFFDSLCDVGEVVVIGHSIGEADHAYFKKIIASIRPDATWHVTYHSANGRESILDNLQSIGLHEDVVTLLRTKDLVLKQPELFD